MNEEPLSSRPYVKVESIPKQNCEYLYNNICYFVDITTPECLNLKALLDKCFFNKTNNALARTNFKDLQLFIMVCFLFVIEITNKDHVLSSKYDIFFYVITYNHQGKHKFNSCYTT